MRKKIALLLITIVFIAAFYVLIRPVKKQVLSTQSEIINYKLENKNYRLFVADSPEEWTKGLMFYRKLDNVDGMLFVFPEKRQRTFWNKNTYLDLDLYWIDKDKVVGKSELPSIEKSKSIVVVNSPSEINRVIELVK